MGSNTELRLTRELDGSSQQFSRKFWNIVCSRVPGLDKRFAGGISITAVEYEDRYLRSPLQFKVLFEMLKQILASKGNKKSEAVIRVRTEVLPSRGYIREPQGLLDDWSSSPDRKLVFQYALETISGSVSIEEFGDRVDLKHQRELRITWKDGFTWTMRLDEGVGWLKPSRWTEFPFRSDPKMQVAKMHDLVLDLQMRNRNGTVLYLFPLSS